MCIEALAALTLGEQIMVAATAFNAVSNIAQGMEREAMYDAQSAQAAADAQAERELGQIRAEKLRRAGRSQQSEARAALAASGVEVDAGTPVRIQQEIDRRYEADAMQEILFAGRRGSRLEQESTAFRIAGDRAGAGGWRRAGGSILSGGAEIGRGWVTNRPRDTSNDFLYDANSEGVVRIG